MSPREQKRSGNGGRRPRGSRGSTGRRRGRTAVVVLAALALVVVGVLVGAVAVIFGLVPGFRVRSPIERLPTDSVAADSVPAVPSTAAVQDTTAHPVLPLPTDSTGASAAPGLVTPADSAAGEVVYRGAGRCLSCHGTTGEGVAGLGPSLRDDRWIVGDGSPAAIARAVRDGVSPPKEFPIAMPAYAGQLPEEAIGRVAAYVYAISHVGAVPRDSLATPADSARVPRPTVPAPPTLRPTVPAPAPSVPRPTVPR